MTSGGSDDGIGEFYRTGPTEADAQLDDLFTQRDFRDGLKKFFGGYKGGEGMLPLAEQFNTGDNGDMRTPFQ
jgi:hypothetical protein